jgi:hypothetical protein
MVIADFSSSFLSPENAQENDIIVIIGKPREETKISQAGTPYVKVNIPVEINGKEKTYSPSRDTGKRFVEAWGKEMDNWLAHKATIKIIQVKGKPQIEAYPLQ